MEKPFADYVGVLEAATILKLHPDTVHRYREGTLKAMKFHRMWLIHKKGLEEFKQARQHRRKTNPKEHPDGHPTRRDEFFFHP